MGNLLNFSFWFNVRPGALALIPQIVLLVAAALLLALFIFTLVYKRKRNVNRKLLSAAGSFAITNFFIGLFLWFFSFERLPLLSARFWFVLWAAGVIFWLWFLNRKKSHYEQKKRLYQKESELKKYYP